MRCFQGLIGKESLNQDIYVVSHATRCLLGQPAIKLLKLIKRVGVVQDYAKMITRGFHELFQGLGKMEGEYIVSS